MKETSSLIKVMIILVISVTFIPSLVSAEQAAAEQYRQMFKNGTFYVEYRVEKNKTFYDGVPIYFFSGRNGVEIIAAKNGKRIRTLKNAKQPDVLYQNGKYYRFLTNFMGSFKGISIKDHIKVIALSEDELNAPYLDPNEGWQFIRRDLSLPEEIAVFYWDDVYRDNYSNSFAPKYNGSSKRTIGKKEYDCDQYVNYIASLANTNIAIEAYNMLYDKGQLIKIQKYFIRDGKEYLIRELNIKSITSQVPEKIINFNKKYKVYAAHKGDMNDLLEKSEQIEEIGGSK